MRRPVPTDLPPSVQAPSNSGRGVGLGAEKTKGELIVTTAEHCAHCFRSIEAYFDEAATPSPVPQPGFDNGRQCATQPPTSACHRVHDVESCRHAVPAPAPSSSH